MKQADSNPLAKWAEILLRPGASRAATEAFCAEAGSIGVYGVLVPTSRVELARALLEGSEAKVIALIDYPLGEADSDVRRYETEAAVDLGAQEVQLALPAARLKDGESNALLREMRDVVEAADERPVTYVLEGDLLTADEVRTACELVLDSGILGIAAGVIPRAPVDAEFIRGLRAMLGPKLLIKAAGAFPHAETAQALLAAGANRVQGFLESLRKADG